MTVPTGERWASDLMASHLGIIDALAATAGDATGWLAVRRQATTYRRHLPYWRQLPGPNAAEPAASATWAHITSLEERLDRAEMALSAYDPGTVARAGMTTGIRLAVVGKGGVGKSVIVGVLARLLAQRGRKVLAADLDANPGLAYSLGLGLTEAGLPYEALEENPRAAYGWGLASGLSPAQAVERFAAVGPDGVRYLGLGKMGLADRSATRRSVDAVTGILLGFGDPGWDVIADLDAGPSGPFQRYHSFADTVSVVVGPSWRSALTARRLVPLVDDGRRISIVANRYGDQPDHPDLDFPMVRIPEDPQLNEAERQGLSPIDACPDSEAVAAIGRLVDRIVPQEAMA